MSPVNRMRGYASRKLWYAAATSLLIFGAALIASCSATFRACLETTDGALLGVFAIYAGANVGSQHVMTRNLGPSAEDPAVRVRADR